MANPSLPYGGDVFAAHRDENCRAVAAIMRARSRAPPGPPLNISPGPPACPVCFTAFAVVTHVCVLRCDHRICADCIDSLNRTQDARCPVCRKSRPLIASRRLRVASQEEKGADEPLAGAEAAQSYGT